MNNYPLYTLVIVGLIVGLTCWFVRTDDLIPNITDMRHRLRGAIHSRTIWLNTLVLVFIHNLPDAVDYLASNLPMLQPYLPQNHYTTIMGAIAIANLILRFKTTHPLEAK